MENYIMFDGEKILLTKKQEEILRRAKNAKTIENRFDVIDGETFSIIPHEDDGLIKKQSKNERLSQLLLKFANKNHDEPTYEDWKDEDMSKYYIDCSMLKDYYYVGVDFSCKTIGTQYFKTAEICQRAIEEVVIPFVNGEID